MITGAPKAKNGGVPLLKIPFPGTKPRDARLRLQMVKLAECARAGHDGADVPLSDLLLSLSMRMLLLEVHSFQSLLCDDCCRRNGMEGEVIMGVPTLEGVCPFCALSL